jgi:hypothetical protein
VQDFASLGEESSHIGTGIHWTGQDVGVLVVWLGLANERSEDSGQSDGLFHGTTRACGCQSLQVEGEVVLDGSRGLHGLNLQGGTDVGEGAGAEREGFGMVCLPVLVFRPQIKGA